MCLVKSVARKRTTHLQHLKQGQLKPITEKRKTRQLRAVHKFGLNSGNHQKVFRSQRETTYRAFTKMMKSFVFLVAILTILVFGAVTDVESACGTLGRGKRINTRCQRQRLKKKTRAFLKNIVMELEQNNPPRV